MERAARHLKDGLHIAQCLPRLFLQDRADRHGTESAGATAPLDGDPADYLPALYEESPLDEIAVGPEAACVPPVSLEELGRGGFVGAVFDARPVRPLEDVWVFAPGPDDLVAEEVLGVTTRTGLGGGEGLTNGFGADGLAAAVAT